MNGIEQFFALNHDIMYVAYGQVFLILGIAITLQSRKHSQLEFARYLWLLACFGFGHGLVEWGYVFIPIQAGYMAPAAVNLLWITHTTMLAISFYFLFQFGAFLIAAEWPRWRPLIYLPIVALAIWIIWFFFISPLWGMPAEVVFRSGDIMARYGLALPGTALTAFGLLRQSGVLAKADMPRISRYFWAAGLLFAFYALVAGVVVADPLVVTPRGSFVAWPGELFPTALVNMATFRSWTGLPIVIFRSLAGLGIAYCIVRALEVFQIETDRLIMTLARERSLAEERERIGRELHDGIIQSIYGAGLSLDDAYQTVDQDAAQAKTKVRAVMGQLDNVVRDIRNYIFDLRTRSEEGSLDELLELAVKELRVNTLLAVDFKASGKQTGILTASTKLDLIQIAREALANVAQHAHANHVEVTLRYQSDQIELEIVDNGVGFAPGDPGAGFDATHHNASDRRGRGLENMRERIEHHGGSITVDSVPGQGTHITAEIPYEGVRRGQAVAHRTG